MGINVRTKGHGGEREIAQLLREHLGIIVERNVDQVRDGGADIISVRPFAIEIKRQQQLSIKRWLAQAVRQTTKKNPVPVLMFRQDRQPWRVIFPLNVVARKKYRVDGSWCEVDMPSFLELAKKIRGE